MKKTLIHTLASVCLMLPVTCLAQEENLSDSALQEKIAHLQIVPNFNTPEAKENPRGVYKLMHTIGRGGDMFKEPFDQYKICTDSVTLMMVVNGNHYRLGKNDSRIFNYTGSAPDPQDSTATRIYDSNQQHFTLKWWSKSGSGAIFPDNDWCTEYYESDKYSEAGKVIFDALMVPIQRDKNNPFLGSWRVLGMIDEMRDMNHELERLNEEDKKRNPRSRAYHILTPTYFINTTATQGFVHNITYNSKRSITIGPRTYQITWLTKNRVAIELHEGFHVDYEIWERIPDGEPVFSKLVSPYVN